jgi:hypothetical protein
VNQLNKAKAALAAIVAAPEKARREKWSEYGAALNAQRPLMASDREFGQWIKDNGLDQGVAAHYQIRSDAMWLAEHWSNVVADYNGKSHHPLRIRQECRKAGFEWAGETKRQTERKANSVRSKSSASVSAIQRSRIREAEAKQQGLHVIGVSKHKP